MRALATASFLAGTSLSLLGCGGGGNGATTASPNPDPTPSPTPVTVQPVWENHLAAFLAFDVPRILEDYDDDSKVATFNDNCFVNMTENRGYKVYEGKAQISAMFTNLFQQLSPDNSTVTNVGPLRDQNSPVVLEAPRKHDGNVFLTWRAAGVDKPILTATDSFSFRVTGGKTMIDLQTIVTTEESTPCVDAPGQSPTTGDEPIYAAWKNHFDAFGTKNVDMIMADYTDKSIVQVFDNRDETYTKYDTLASIKAMFVGLFDAIKKGDAGDGQGEGVEVGLLEIEPKYSSVFLAWKSFSHPKATDTFIFHVDAGVATIARQNIVVTTKAPAPGVSEGVMV